MFWGGSSSEGNQAQITLYVGIAATIIVSVAAVALVHFGRRFYRQYRQETGRVN